MNSYEQTLRLFERWCKEEMRIDDVDKITESVIRRYINDLQTRGKYSFYSNDRGKEKSHPERRRDFRKPISVCTINNYIRNLRVFFNWLDIECVIKKNPMRRIQQLKTNRKAKDYISDEDFKKLVNALLGFISVLCTKVVSVGYAESDNLFTSDHAMYGYRNSIESSFDFKTLWFPINSDCVLLFSDPSMIDRTKKNCLIPISEEETRELNNTNADYQQSCDNRAFVYKSSYFFGIKFVFSARYWRICE